MNDGLKPSAIVECGDEFVARIVADKLEKDWVVRGFRIRTTISKMIAESSVVGARFVVKLYASIRVDKPWDRASKLVK